MTSVDQADPDNRVFRQLIHHCRCRRNRMQVPDFQDKQIP